MNPSFSFRLFFVLFLSLFLSTGCSSRLKKAQEMLIEKNYAEALTIFEDLLAKDPNNEEAQLGLRKAREGVIDKDLIQVRLLRLAANTDESLELLKSILDRQNLWQVFPTGAVAFTQKEEIEMSYKNLKKELRLSLDQRKALKASFLLNRYSFIFSEAQKNELKAYGNEAQSQGQALCKQDRKTRSPQLPFWSEFVDKVCSLYSVKSLAKANDEKNFDKGLYKDLIFSLKSQKFDLEDSQRVQQEFQKAFAETAWKDKDSSRSLIVASNTDYSYYHSSTPKTLTHFYTEKVPYTTYAQVQTVNPSTGQTETKTEPQTAYREETRHISYEAVEHYLRTEFKSTNQVSFSEPPLNPLVFEISFSKSDSGQGMESFSDSPSIGLYKQQPSNIYPSSYFFNSFLKDFYTEVQKKLVAKYIELNCENITQQTDALKKSNQSLKCLRQTKKSAPPATVQWSLDRYDVKPWMLDELQLL